MAKDTGGHKGPAKPQRIARGFTRAGGLIGSQMRTVQARRGFAEARLRAQWREIVGPELAAICRPVKLNLARGPAGGLLKLGVSGAHAPQVQMLLPVLRERINAALGPGAVGRIQLAQAMPGAVAAPTEAAVPPAPPRPSRQIPPAMAADLSSIGDDDLRRALETLARNVLSRGGNSPEPES
jgi:hypothetical protein